MKNQLDIQLMLSVFEKVRSHGLARDGEYELDGMRVSSDFDGYTAFFDFEQTSLTIGFHNQYQFNYANNEALEAFLDTANRIARNYR